MEKITLSLSCIFNLSVRTRVLADDFNIIANVAPVFKTGDKSGLRNYRLISILLIIARDFEKLIYNQLYSYFLRNRLLGSELYGFKLLHPAALTPGKISTSWLMNILDDWEKNFVVFVDIRKVLTLLTTLSCFISLNVMVYTRMN